jgi:hypothetical protein
VVSLPHNKCYQKEAICHEAAYRNTLKQVEEDISRRRRWRRVKI